MRKLFTLTLALLASFSLWATTKTYSFAAASELNNFTYTAGDASDVWSVYTSKTNNVDPRDGGFVQYKNAKSNTTATFVTKDSFDKISNISFYIASSDKGKTKVKIEISSKADFSSDVTEVVDAGGLSDLGVSSPANSTWYPISLDVSDKSGYIRFTMTSGSSGKFWSYDDIVVTYTPAPTCTAPTKALSLTANKTTGVEAGDVITLSIKDGTGNGSTVSYKLDGAAFTAASWTATAGTHTFIASQEDAEVSSVLTCGTADTLVLNVAATDPVTSCTIAGPEDGFIGSTLTYTATAANADADGFKWYVDETLQAETSATFNYTGVKGNHTIYATATNGYTATPVKSNEIALTVTKLCGELIKAVYDPSSKTSTVTGVVGGTADRNTQDNGKLGSNGHYYGVKLTSGSFMAGDVVTVIASALNGGNTATIYADKTGTTLLGSQAFDGESLTATVTLAQSADVVYLYRKDSGCNPNIASLSVTRSCEESDDASVKSLTVNGVAVAKDAELNKFEYTVSTNYAEENVTVAFTIHPLATSDKVGNTFTIPTPSAGDTNGASFKVTAEDGTQVTYTVFITKAASLSDDATLKALSVEGYEISPAFDAETTAYTITKAYGAETPAVGKVTATPNDANANAEVVLAADVYTITVTAEDGTTTKEYTITVNTADAKKDLLEASFSNGANGYILNGNIRVPHLAGTSEPTFTAARFWNADGEPTAEIVDGKLVVTGADAKTAQYTIEYVEVTPMEASYDLITFTEVPSYIFSVYGWDADKGVKFSKDVEQAGTKRVSEGRDRIYIALPAAKSVILTGGSAGARPIKVTVNGVVDSKVTSTPAKDETITISLNQSEANFIGIESNGNNGDAGFTKMQLVQSDPTALDNTADEIKAVKFIENGQLFIRRGEKVYTITGEEVK